MESKIPQGSSLCLCIHDLIRTPLYFYFKESIILTGVIMEGKKTIIPIMVLAVLLMAGIAVAGVASTITSPTTGNATWEDTNLYLMFNITLNQSAANVTVQNNTGAFYALVNDSTSDGTMWGDNLTDFSESTWDASSCMNISISINQGGANETNISYCFYVDTITPVVANYTDLMTVTNASGGDNVLMSSSIVDNATASCGYYLYRKALASDAYVYQTSVSGTVSNLSVSKRTPNCNTTIEHANFTADGYWEIEGYATDNAGHTGVTSFNKTIIVTTLQANQWNLIGALYDDNITRGANLMNWVANHSSISYISAWNESAMSFFTHQANTGTYNTTVIGYGDALFVYPNTDIVLIRENVTVPDTYQNHTMENKSLSGVWSLVGNIYGDFNLSSIADATTGSSYAVFYNNTNGMFYPYKRGFGPTKNDYNVIKGLGVILDTNSSTDIVLNRRTY